MADYAQMIPQNSPYLGGLTREMIINLVIGRWDESDKSLVGFDKKLKDFYNLFRCIYTGSKPPWKNVVMLPLLQSAIWSDAANKLAILMSEYRIIEMSANQDGAVASAKRAESMTNQQFADMRMYEKFLDFIVMGDMYGTAIYRYGWRQEGRIHRLRHSVFGMEYEDETMVQTFNGPDINTVDLLDFRPQRGKRDIPSMLYVHHRYWMDLDDMEEENFNAMQMGKQPPWDPMALKELRSVPISNAQRVEMNDRYSVWRSWSDFQEKTNTRFERPVEIIEQVGLVPREYAPDGIRLRIMTLGNRCVPLRNVPLPNWSLEKFFISHSPMPDPHYFHGIGKIEPVATLAATANKLVSNRLDVLDLVLQPALFVSDSTELDVQNLVLWPGRVIKIQGETGEANIRPVQFDLSAYPLVVNELESIGRYIDQGTGIQRDTVMGMLSGDRQTAREFLGRMEQARTRLGLETRLLEIQVVERLANAMVGLTRQYGSFPYMVSRLGADAIFDPDTGQPIPQDQMEVNLADINMDHKIRAVGATNYLSKSMQKQDFIAAMQVMSQNPFALQKTNWDAFLSKWWRAFDFEPSEMMLRQPNMLPPEEGGTAGAGPPQGPGLPQLGGGTLNPQDPRLLQLMGAMGAGLQQNVGQ
jgi:hypothetical protein